MARSRGLLVTKIVVLCCILTVIGVEYATARKSFHCTPESLTANPDSMKSCIDVGRAIAACRDGRLTKSSRILAEALMSNVAYSEAPVTDSMAVSERETKKLQLKYLMENETDGMRVMQSVLGKQAPEQ